MSTISVTIPSISCKHCVHTIKTELLDEIKGVQSVEASVDDKSVTIEYQPPASEEAIIQLLKEINYPPQE